jgi:hypothetical protein
MEQTLIEAISDYVSISLLNARLFRALNASVHTSKEGEKQQNALLESVRGLISEELPSAVQSVNLLLREKLGSLNEPQRQALRTARAALQRLTYMMERTTPAAPTPSKKK